MQYMFSKIQVDVQNCGVSIIGKLNRGKIVDIFVLIHGFVVEKNISIISNHEKTNNIKLKVELAVNKVFGT